MPQSLEEMAIALARAINKYDWFASTNPINGEYLAKLNEDAIAERILAALSAARAQALEEALRCLPLADDAFNQYDVVQGKAWTAGVRAKWQGIRALLDSPSAAPERPADRDEVEALKADIATYVQISTDQANEIERLRDALRPFALVAERIDRHPGGGLRPDDSTFWQRNTERRSPFDLTMGHVRAARRLLEDKP